MSDHEFFELVAQECRELAARTDSKIARAQLRLWADEFSARAVAAQSHETADFEPG